MRLELEFHSLPIGKEIIVSGKISFFRNKYQITNPKYISEDSSVIKTKHNQYSLTEGITEKLYNKIIKQIIKDLPKLDEWHNKEILKIIQCPVQNSMQEQKC